MKQKISLNPHDSYFAKSMEDMRVAKGFFQQHLAADIKQAVNLDTLALRKDTFISPEFRHAITDLLFSVELDGRAGYLYTLVEHQSTPDRQMPFRVLRYMLLIMEQHMREQGTHGKQVIEKPLPVIVPVVFYQGKQRPYPYSTDIFDLFDDPSGIAAKTFCKPFSLVDLSQISDEVLRKEKWSGLMSLFMKHAYERDILQFIDENVGELLRCIEQSRGGDYYIEMLAKYIAHTSESNQPENVLATLSKHLSSQTGEKIMTIAEHFIQKGRKQGIEQGMKQVVQNMLDAGIDKNTIAKVTQLSSQEIEQMVLAKH